jgi:hypothetical protein
MPTNNRNKIKEANEQQLHERLRVLTSSNGSNKNPIDDFIDNTTDTTDMPIQQAEPANAKDLVSLQNRFGVSKINRPVKDAQLTARIDSKTLKRFKDIVKQMYYPDKPNINETVTQIIRAFVEEYDKHGQGRDKVET